MSNNINVYITFPATGHDIDWRNLFIENLKFAVKKINASTVDLKVKNVDFKTIEASNKYLDSDLFLILFAPSTTETDAGFQQELINIETITTAEGKINAGRIFKVLPAENDAIAQPPNIKLVNGYTFYDYSTRRKTTTPYAFESENPNAWSRLLDIAYDINYLAQPKSDGGTGQTSKYVYLGYCSIEQNILRDNIRRQLQHSGYRVLPVFQLPIEQLRINEMVVETLPQCCFIVQVVGENYGKMTSEGKMSQFDAENQAIRQFLFSHPDKKQFIWIPSQMKISDAKQELYISRIKREDSNKQSEIIEASPEEFKSILERFLTLPEQDFTQHNPEKIYLISHQGANSPILQQVAEKYGAILITNTKNSTPITYKEHLRILESVNHVIIYLSQQNTAWLKSKIGDAIKAMGMGRKKPFSQVSVVSKIPVSLEEFTPWISNLENITESETDKLNTFFQKALE